MHLETKKKDASDEKKYKFVWTREGRILFRTEEESLQRVPNPKTGKPGMPKPHTINKPQDLEKYGWQPQEIIDIISNNNRY